MVILFAPNVHTGGGIVLLRALLSAWERGTPLVAFLDARSRANLVLPIGPNVSWVARTFTARLAAEMDLRKTARPEDTVLCFHGLPPQLPSSARIVVFLQNRHLIGLNPLSQFSWKSRLRLRFERLVTRAFRNRVSLYVVQTPSMERAVMDWYGPSRRKPKIKVLPFIDAVPKTASRDSEMNWDFVYVADGEAHKNHHRLLAAWELLAREDLRPSLAITLGRKDERLAREIQAASAKSDLRIVNLGAMPREDVMTLYARATALIFPSTSESFGLPLIEAARCGLPILAPELDYVRDVCTPVHTFDPHSSISIARAVKRFLGTNESALRLRTPTEFWSELLSEVPENR